MELKGKKLFLTGGAKRLGRAMAERFLDEGVHLATSYRNSENAAKELIEYAKKRGTTCHIYPLDLASTNGISSLRSSLFQDFGSLDILIFSSSDFYPTQLADVSETEWDHFHNVNLKTNFFLLQALLPLIKTGTVLFLLDINAEKPLKNFTPYVAAKAGLRMLMRNLSHELAPKIRVNGISPGPVLLPEGFTEGQKQRAIETTLLKKLGTPEAVTEAALFLIENDYITGMDLKIDGGASL